MTDEGEESVGVPSKSQIDRFRTLFVDVTGTEAVVIDQDQGVASRDIDDDDVSISDYVAAGGDPAERNRIWQRSPRP